MPTLRKWLVRCDPCDKSWEEWAWNYELPVLCKSCNEPTYLWNGKLDEAPGIIGDDIPGGVVINHLTPTPQRFYSKTEIKRACNELGWTQMGDTPKPYNVAWSGKSKEAPRPEPIIKPSAD